MEKIRNEHLRRIAVVYLRQSSMAQVRSNLESQRLQYGLTERAEQLGWKQIEVIDTDLGLSAAAGGHDRPGFNRLISMVAQGRVGIILSREASRLSRNDQDWCRLLEVCSVFDTLIGDDDHVYDVGQMDDQLMLGIKGTLSVVELGVLRLRMQRGREAKAMRGRLKFRLPAGYMYDVDGHPVKDSSLRVKEAVALVFRRFREVQNGRQLFMWFHDEGMELPVYQYVGGKLSTEWRVPTLQYLVGILKNPFYGGAYVYGRRPRETVLIDGRLVTRTSKLRAPEECRVFIPDHHEAYISWKEYLENQAIFQRNRPRRIGSDSMTSSRAGVGLLVGLLRCGHCGRKLHVNYWGRSGTSPRYMCRGVRRHAGDGCLSFSGTLVEQELKRQVLAAVSPLGIEASVVARESVCQAASERLTLLQRRAEQLRYEADRAFEQYDEVDPKNRLVAAELERRWNAKLAAAEQAASDLAEATRANAQLDEPALIRLQHLGEHFEEAWNSLPTTEPLKKNIIRAVVEEIVVRRADSELIFVVHWTGGVHTEFRLERPLPGTRKTSADALDIIRAMAERHDDSTIAAVLNRNGKKTGQGKSWNSPRVASARRRHGIPPQSTSIAALGLLSLKGAAAHAGVSQATIHKLIASGLLRNEQTVSLAPFEIHRTDIDSKSVQAVLSRLRLTGRLDLGGALAVDQIGLFQGNQGDDNAR